MCRRATASALSGMNMGTPCSVFYVHVYRHQSVSPTLVYIPFVHILANFLPLVSSKLRECNDA